MPDTEFTKGPWRVSSRSATYVEGPDSRGICATGGYTDSRIDGSVLWAENEANAHLIAAAPDMYEALEMVADPDVERDDAFYNKIADTLSKARGEGNA